MVTVSNPAEANYIRLFEVPLHPVRPLKFRSGAFLVGLRHSRFPYELRYV